MNSPAARPALPFRFRLARHAFQGVRAISTPLAARLAERLFLTPPRLPQPLAEKDILAAGRAYRLPFEGGTLAVWTWGPKRGAAPTVLLLHGWGGRGGQLQGFVRPLLESGFRVVAYDSLGHGASAGNRASIFQFAAALRTVAQVTGPIHGLIAHSLGCAGASVALSQGLEVERACFIAPPAEAESYYRKFLGFLGLPELSVPDFSRRFAARFRFAWNELDMAVLAPRMRIPLQVFHDAGDRDVAFQDGASVATFWPGARLHRTEGLGHHRILKSRDVQEKAVAFLSEDLDFRSCVQSLEAELFEPALRGSRDA